MFIGNRKSFVLLLYAAHIVLFKFNGQKLCAGKVQSYFAHKALKLYVDFESDTETDEVGSVSGVIAICHNVYLLIMLCC